MHEQADLCSVYVFQVFNTTQTYEHLYLTEFMSVYICVLVYVYLFMYAFYMYLYNLHLMLKG